VKNSDFEVEMMIFDLFEIGALIFSFVKHFVIGELVLRLNVIIVSCFAFNSGQGDLKCPVDSTPFSKKNVCFIFDLIPCSYVIFMCVATHSMALKCITVT